MTVSVLGAGPAGTSAALAALACGAEVRVFDRSRGPRHKVCGEFLSHGIIGELDALGLRSAVAARAAAIRRVSLFLGNTAKTETLPEAALGLSRFALDSLLLDTAVERGGLFQQEVVRLPAAPCVLATGRRPAPPDAEREDRLFGFKAHFRGPANDAVELYFFRDCYVGVNAVEDGLTNVCGLGPRRVLASFGFDPEALARSYAPLAERLAPLERQWDWLHTGPLVFGNLFDAPPVQGQYPAGDALSFVDPFTGSGLTAAILTGRLAGKAAAEGQPVQHYLKECRRALGQPYLAAAIVRRSLALPVVPLLARLVPAAWLYRLTRPQAHSN